MIKLPPQTGWTQPNINDISGSLWSSMGINLTEEPGIIRISGRSITTTDNITDLGVPVAFQVFTDVNGAVQYAWTIAGSYVFRMNVANGYQTSFAKDAATASPTVCSSDVSDLFAYGKTHMFATVSNDIYLFTASSGQWTDYTGTPLTSQYPHMGCTYAGRAYIVDEGTKIKSLTSALNDLTTSGSNFLDLTNKHYPVTLITTIKAVSDGIWIFTINQQKNGCYAFKWDGNTATDPNRAYILPDTSGILACVIKDDAPWVMDNNGSLRVFTNSTFAETKDLGFANGRLPVKKTKFLKNPLSAVNDRWIHPNGMQIVDGRINILVNNEYNDSGATIEENLPSGIWEYDPKIGWYHKMSMSLYVSSITDYGQNRVSRVGALYANKYDTTNASANGIMLMGAQLFSNASSTKQVIAINDSNDTVIKAGYIVTPKISASADKFSVKDTFNKCFVLHQKFLTANDKIVIKYRTVDVSPTEATITWVNATSFTSTADLSAYAVGDEVEITQGTGSGTCSHITAISAAAGTYTVVVEETHTGATGTAKARFQHWIKSGTIQDIEDFDEVPIMAVGTWIQLKVWMSWTGPNEFSGMSIINSVNRKME